MTMSFNNGVINLSGKCGIDEAEALVSYLSSHPEAVVDVAAATEIHTALWQTLMVFMPTVSGFPVSPSAAADLLPCLLDFLKQGSKATAANLRS
ncbi:hypothetical protein [Rhizobium sp.]|uniref:hypothetical protein n=1 Tax=Rhizobium sp. TaxID=391 RepID=UPI0028AF4943